MKKKKQNAACIQLIIVIYFKVLEVYVLTLKEKQSLLNIPHLFMLFEYLLHPHFPRVSLN